MTWTGLGLSGAGWKRARRRHDLLPPLRRYRLLLWIDCSAGFFGGVIVLALRGWLSEVYALPQALLVTIGTANVAYGLFSFSLAMRPVRPRALIVLLVFANATWAVACGVTAIVLASSASVFGLAHLLLEGLVVGGLAVREWQWREQLRLAR